MNAGTHEPYPVHEYCKAGLRVGERVKKRKIGDVTPSDDGGELKFTPGFIPRDDCLSGQAGIIL